MEQNQEKINWPDFLATVSNRLRFIDLCGLNGSAAAYALTCIRQKNQMPVMVITGSVKEAEVLCEELRFFLKDTTIPVFYFPPYNILPYKVMAYHNETAARRIRTLFQIVESLTPPVVVSTIGAVIQRLIPKKELVDFSELILAGEEIERDALIRKLVAGGYTRAMLVEEPGDFIVRGGILDIFSPLYSDPLRIEFFGDVVDSLRLFSADTQRTIQELNEAVVLPAREAILPPHALNAFVGRVRARAAELDLPVTQVREIVQRIKTEGLFPGIEGLIPFIYDKLDTVLDYLPSQSLFVLMEPTRIEAVLSEFFQQAQAAYASACEKQHLCLPPADLYLNWHEISKAIAPHKPVNIKMLSVSRTGQSQDDGPVVCDIAIGDTLDIRQSLLTAQKSEKPFQPMVDWFQQQHESGHSIVVVCRRPSHVEKLKSLLPSYGISPVGIENFNNMSAGQRRLYLTAGTIANGFIWPQEQIAFISDEEIFGTSYRPQKAKKQSDVAEILNFGDLKQGDLVVHIDHGIGRYEGLVKLHIEGLINDFLLVAYQDDDKLYLPVERMNQIQKYMGVDGCAPIIDKMGGKTWERLKLKVKQSTEKIAGELLKLYAARKVREGYAFGGVDTHFQDFEDGFPYEETSDQRKAIDAVLQDMRQKTPMDRLICGDVGYGKTEVGLRAAFTAISEAKQVAVLVPTTVLAEQHFNTFSERFKLYPVKVACLSRFRPAKEQRDIIAGIKNGTIDIVIGTHRLLQKDVVFNDLGLLVLDEEQRFGVRHKEKIKRMRDTVDVLTLTATPIPRTLHLSLLGIRDISIISTPPEQRRPIVTFVSEFDDTIVAEAIRNELRRNGQIFFVHNHVQSIDRMAAHLKELVPEIRLEVAHGQMPEDQLERVMHDFMHKSIDMLVCTTIIESGLDVATANTILINRADHFGLAQIYQLRGRVGRADEQAYAYLFIPNETTLTKNAQKRLKVLMEYSDLGSGFQIAMSDLKIRGGGSILGASQSGHIAAVGYDMFLKLMEASVAELKGEPIQEALEPEINMPLSAFLPETYIADIDQRLSFYRRLARMNNLKTIGALKTELEDRFGRLPEEAANLLLKIMLKVLSVRAGVRRLDLTDRYLSLQFSEAHQTRPFGIVDMVTSQKDRYRFSPDHIFTAALNPAAPNALLSQAKNILIEIARHVNQ